HGAPSFRQMLDINEEFVGKGTNIVVQRGSESINKWIVPKERESGAKIGIARTVDLMNPVVARVLEGSPAAKAGLEPGARIRAINKTEVNNWIDVFNALKALSGKKVKITYQLGVQKKTVEIGKLDDTKFDASDYQFAVLSGEMPLKTLQIRIQKKNPLTALAWGGRETLRMILSTYVSLRSLILGNVSAKSLSGPVGIGSLAIKVGRDRPLVDFVYFLAFISTALAVFNFLPLPVVDGGHAVFLLIEKVRGKPISVKIMNIVQMIGLVLILLLFVVLTWNDIAKWMKELW
ncbi:MAG: RIP metalloprotease RseP, partial [Phycisphaerae bacterium]|nr:RIP metalloprotease RseP [Phycisphaerae bacterium]